MNKMHELPYIISDVTRYLKKNIVTSLRVLSSRSFICFAYVLSN